MTNPKDIGIEAYDLFQKLGGGLCDEQECCLHGIGHELTDAFLHALASYKASLLKELVTDKGCKACGSKYGQAISGTYE